MKRVGFFAGSFDPIHDGHLEVARTAVRELDLNILYFMVEEQPWGNKSPVDVKHRRNMIEIVAKDDSKINQLELSDKQFSIESTLSDLETKFQGSELYFVFGADVFMKMNEVQWPDLNDLLKHYIVVFERNNTTEKEISSHAQKLRIVVAIIPSQFTHYSSTDVRLKPYQNKIWLPKEVANYIKENGLYNVTDSFSE